MLTVDLVLLIPALLCVVVALTKNSVQYCCVALLLVIVDLLIHVIPRG